MYRSVIYDCYDDYNCDCDHPVPRQRSLQELISYAGGTYVNHGCVTTCRSASTVSLQKCVVGVTDLGSVRIPANCKRMPEENFCSRQTANCCNETRRGMILFDYLNMNKNRQTITNKLINVHVCVNIYIYIFIYLFFYNYI